MQEVLVFAAHPDDELLGVGGTVRLLANQGVRVRAVILAEGLTSRRDSRAETAEEDLHRLWQEARRAGETVGYAGMDFCGFPDNRMDSIDLLDIVKRVSGYVEKYRPDTIFTHHHGDLNIDHRLTFQAVITACRPVKEGFVKRIYTFETPSSTEWNFAYDRIFTPNLFVDVSDTLEAKIQGMQCYSSEACPSPHPRSGESLRALAAYRGSTAGVLFAEAFSVIREIRKSF